MRTISLTATVAILQVRFHYHNSIRTMSLAILLCLFYAPVDATTINLNSGSDVPKQTTQALEEGFASVLELNEQLFGYRLIGPVNAYASSDPEFIAKAKMKERSIPKSYLSQQILAWTNERNHEAGYRFLLMKTNSQAFRGGAKPQKGPLHQMLSHEVFHLIQYELVGSKARKCCNQNKVSVVGPTWLMEGSADYAMWLYSNAKFQMPMRRAVDEMRRKSAEYKDSLSALETGNTFYQTQNAYFVGGYATHLLVKKGGPKNIISFYTSLRRTNSWKESFSAAFGLSVEDFYKEFDAR